MDIIDSITLCSTHSLTHSLAHSPFKASLRIPPPLGPTPAPPHSCPTHPARGKTTNEKLDVYGFRVQLAHSAGNLAYYTQKNSTSSGARRAEAGHHFVFALPSTAPLRAQPAEHARGCHPFLSAWTSRPHSAQLCGLQLGSLACKLGPRGTAVRCRIV